MKRTPNVFFSVREIGKKAGSRAQFTKNPDWPRPYVVLLYEQGYLNSNPLGQYSYKVEEEKKKRKYLMGNHFRYITVAEANAMTGVGAQPKRPDDDAEERSHHSSASAASGKVPGTNEKSSEGAVDQSKKAA
ncbi:MAG TPA: hypothetical protein VGE41_07985 [Verrucomicrobiae bacterium]